MCTAGLYYRPCHPAASILIEAPIGLTRAKSPKLVFDCDCAQVARQSRHHHYAALTIVQRKAPLLDGLPRSGGRRAIRTATAIRHRERQRTDYDEHIRVTR